MKKFTVFVSAFFLCLMAGLFLKPKISLAQSCTCANSVNGQCQVSVDNCTSFDKIPECGVNTLNNGQCLLPAGVFNCKCIDTPTCDRGNGVNTAIGCIPMSDQNTFLAFILRWAIGIGGGIAFILIIYASFMIMSSSGNPERVQAGKELLTSAIAGLIMLIFSIFILRIIGVKILDIKGLVGE